MKYLKKLWNRTFKSNKVNSFIPNDSYDELNDRYIFDFKNYQSGYSGISINNIVSVGDNNQSNPDEPENSNNNEEDNLTKLAIMPIHVFGELETVPTPFTLENINEKILMLKQKESLIVQKYARREVSAMIERLNNRKKYPKYRKFFDTFQNTTDEKIGELLLKYQHLKLGTTELFIPELPDQAIKTMLEYKEKCLKICKKEPVFYLIARKEDFRENVKKRDPILLVQSPFGFYWQIIGAWGQDDLILLYQL